MDKQVPNNTSIAHKIVRSEKEALAFVRAVLPNDPLCVISVANLKCVDAALSKSGRTMTVVSTGGFERLNDITPEGVALRREEQISIHIRRPKPKVAK